MTVSFQREELHRLIDHLDEKWLGKAYGLLRGDIFEQKPPKKKDRWNALRTKIHSFTLLPKNWDGYGGIPLSPSVADACLHFLKLLPDAYLELLEPENISPTPYSTVTMDWENGADSFLTLEIGKRTANFFARLPGGKTLENEQLSMFGEYLPEDLLDALQHLFPSVSFQS